MTVIERRFRGGRFDYEVKYTVESKRFDALAPTLRKSLDSFRELPGPGPGRHREGGVSGGESGSSHLADCRPPALGCGDAVAADLSRCTIGRKKT